MENDIAIRVEGLGKCYQRANSGGVAVPYRTLREEVMAWPRRWLAGMRGGHSEAEFWALRDVSFDVRRGEVLGIIGRNGAGKSTLLKVLSRIVDPTLGGADVWGRVGSLLEVGTGFHPELTGRENIYLSGALLGMRRAEVRARLDDIVAFAGVERSLDQPVKQYSSGMSARLGFAVAAHLTSEILLVDEVLAVGDAEFKARCLDKMGTLSHRSGRTILFVSHEPTIVRSLCRRSLVLAGGQVVFDGPTEEAFSHYNSARVVDGGRMVDAFKITCEHLKLVAVRCNGSEARTQMMSAETRTLAIEVEIVLTAPLRVAIEFRLCDKDGAVLALFSPAHVSGLVPGYPAGRHTLRARASLPALLRGRYSLWFTLADSNVSSWADAVDAVVLEADGVQTKLGAPASGGPNGLMMLESADEC
jgi:lipopolysaccharide transport system ATP-binding protein